MTALSGHATPRAMTRMGTAVIGALLAAQAATPGTAQANPLVAVVAAAPSGIVLAPSAIEARAIDTAAPASAARAAPGGALAEQGADALQTASAATGCRVEGPQRDSAPASRNAVIGAARIAGTAGRHEF